MSTVFRKLSTIIEKILKSVEIEAGSQEVITMGVGIFGLFFTISLTRKKRCDITTLMSKRRLNNLLKRKFSTWGSLWITNTFWAAKKSEANYWMKNQFEDISRLGGKIVVMQMGN